MSTYSQTHHLCRLTALVALFCFTSLTVASSPMAPDDVSVDPEQLGCHKRKYTYRVSQSDKFGRSCWDFVSVNSCFGRCDSNEISDWKFPFKRSYHPVCVYAGRVATIATLRNCDPDTEPETSRYHYLEAVGCKCQMCTSLDTSCEFPKEMHTLSAVKVLDLTGAGMTEEVDY